MCILEYHKKKLTKFFIHSNQVFAVQHVDVCMFSNGKFKNIVAESETNANELTVRSGETLHTAYTLNPQRGEWHT